MIKKLRSMAVFATVVDRGTFRAAAQYLDLAPSRISQTVSDLEQELGVTLLYRSTRQLSLTNEGKILYQKASEMLRAAESGLDAISSISDQPAGELRITAPAFVTQTGLMGLFAEFAKSNSGVNLKFDFSDHARDLISDDFDVGIRAGMVQGGELMTQSIGQSDRILVASPEYVTTRNAASHPEDLEQWDWLRFSMRAERVELISPNAESVSIAGKSRIEVDSAYALCEFAIRGLGLTPLPESMARRGLQQGTLVRVLPEWSIAPLTFYAVWPDKSRRESLTQVFVRFLADNSDRL